MPRLPKSHRRFGSLETEVLRALWAAGDRQSVRQVLEVVNAGRSPALAYTTVMTVMVRLAEKRILERRLVGRGYVYSPVADDEAAFAVQEVVRDYGDAAVAHFVEHARSNPKLYERLRRLIDEDGR